MNSDHGCVAIKTCPLEYHFESNEISQYLKSYQYWVGFFLVNMKENKLVYIYKIFVLFGRYLFVEIKTVFFNAENFIFFNKVLN